MMKKTYTHWYAFISLLFLILFALWFGYLHLNDKEGRDTIKNSITEINIKINSLENELKNFKYSKDTLTQLQYIELQHKILDNRLLLDAKIKELDLQFQNLGTFRISVYSYLVPLILAVLVFFGLRSLALERIKKITDKDLNSIKRVIDSEVWSVDIRKASKLLVIHKGDLDKGVETVLHIKDNEGKPQFAVNSTSQENLTLETIRRIEKTQSFNCLFIENADVTNDEDNPSWANDVSFVKALKDIGDYCCGKGIAVFYFTSGGVNFPNLDNKNYLSSFAKSESQIYPNLMNLLKVRYLLVKNENA